jgi:outer membrane protein OmpA-like peptidoglycan-associated protein
MCDWIIRAGVFRRLILVLASVFTATGLAQAAPVCSTGTDGTVIVSAAATRVNVYYSAPDPVIATTVVPVGATSIPIDTVLGGQASNLHPTLTTSIAAGDILIVAQMIGAEIDSTNNHAAAGDYGDGPLGLTQAGSLNSANFVAGRYEFVIATGPVIGNDIPVEGVGPGNGLVNEYVNSNATTATLGFRRYQVIKVPQFSRLSITGEIVSDRWNGRWGGVSALNVREDLVLQGGSFNADGRGYRGGQFFPERADNTGGLPGNFGFKGEGIAGLPQRLFSRVLLAEAPGTGGEETGPAGYAGTDNLGPAGTAWTRDAGQGAPGTAGSGGGGNEDGGGGGGGNFGRGGSGGRGVDGANTEGVGGASFPQHFPATPDLMVMGGGGGASNGDDTGSLDLTVSSGQAGGGVVFVRSVGIDASGGGSISSDGDSGGTAASEGGGGGGAGGTVLIHTDNSTVDAVGFTAIGGAGGSSLQTLDGGGGGGSGGVIWLSDTTIGSATFVTSGGAAGTGATGGVYNGTDGASGSQLSIPAIAQFDCNFVTLGIAKQLTSQTRFGTSGTVFDLAFTLTVENFSLTTGAINVQISDDLAAAFPNATAITVQGSPALDGFSAPAAPYDGVTQTTLLAGTDTLAPGDVRTISYTVRVDFGADTGPFTTQARVSSAQIAGGFGQVLDLSDAGTDPDPDGDGDPTETFANGGNSNENDATPVVLDLSVDPAACVFNPNPASLAALVTANCSGVETGGSVSIPGMACGAEAGGSVTCTGTASDIGSNPDITTSDPVGNVVTASGDLLVLPDTDGDGIADLLEGTGDSDGDGIADFEDTDSDNDGIPDADETSLPPLSGLDTDNDGIDDAIDVDQTGGVDNDGDGIDDAIMADDQDNDGVPDYRDVDSDNDRIPDILEGNADADSDTLPNFLDLDSDFDGIPDSVEADNVPDLAGTDADNDGIDDAFDVDISGGSDTNTNGIDDAFEPVDTDGDGLPDYLDIDSDADGIPDAIEGTVDTDADTQPDWRDVDADNDGILDSSEGPSGADSDSDGIDDAYDATTSGELDADGNGVVDDVLAVDNNTDGIPDADTDNDGTPDYRDLDSDNDAINDVSEAGQPDVNRDGLADAGSTPIGGAALPDLDADGNPDFQEVDSDNDGSFDIAATPEAGLDGNADGRIDSADDMDGDGIPDVADGSPNTFGDLDTIISPAACVFAPNPALAGDTVTATCSGVENNGTVTIPGMTCSAEAGGSVTCTGTGGAIGSNPLIGTADDAGNSVTVAGDLVVILPTDADGDGISDGLEGTGDTDGDGIPDFQDPDSDNDGIPDIEEEMNQPPLSGDDADGDGIDDAIDVDATGGTDINGDGIDDAFAPTDSDGDGTPNYLDADSDGDGVPDIVEGAGDVDGDGIPNYLDTDSDADGIPDFVEADNLPPLTGMDADTDGIDDALDVDATGGTDANVNGIDDALEPVDTDGDGLPDYQDIDSDDDRIPDAIEGVVDSDGDAMPDWRDLDADNDGILDAAEGPSGMDVDMDGIDDAYDASVTGEADVDGNGVVDDILSVDADMNGIPDADTDDDGTPDYRDLDADNDGINDVIEAGLADVDGDGQADAGSGPVGVGALPDTDNDSAPDFQDVDSDNDGAFDIAGTPDAGLDVNADGRIDVTDDSDGDGLPNGADGMPNAFGDATDSDGDGISNADEGIVDATDSDGDNIVDYLDLDSDGDGVPDALEGSADLDGDGVGNWRDADSDADGIDDTVEASQVPPLSENDDDGDGLPNEIDVDATGGMDANGNGADDLLEPEDTDGDGAPDFLDTDADNDGIPDIIETTVDTDADGVGDWRDTDSDDDGIGDDVEADAVPLLTGADGDGDGLDDALDVDATGGTDADMDGLDDALQPNDTDGDGTPDFRDDDSDGDSIGDDVEGSGDADGDGLGNWRDTDSDGDGVGDDVEGNVDTDGDGVPDYLDPDSDNDGIPDASDNGDKDADGIPDRLDGDEGELETAVRGVGGVSVAGLIVLFGFALLATARRRRSAAANGVLLVAVCLLLPAAPIETAHADNHVCGFTAATFEGCWYAGAGLGLTEVDPEGQAGGWSTVDSSDSGWKVYGGYRFKPHWSVELSYVDGGEARLGNVDPVLEALIPNASIDYRTPSLMAVYWLREPAENWNLFAKLGVSAIDNKASDPLIPFDKQTDVQLAGGIGAELSFAERWFARADLDFYDRDHYYAGLSIGLRWGGAGTVPAPAAAERAQPEPAPVAATPEPAPAPPPPPPPPEPVCEPVTTVLKGVQFESNSDVLTSASRAVLNEVVQRMRESPGDSAEIQAHTDSSGADTYNYELSNRRARSVEDYLSGEAISRARLSSRGYGETNPVADNATPAGRALNRRVEIVWTTERCR